MLHYSRSVPLCKRFLLKMASTDVFVPLQRIAALCQEHCKMRDPRRVQRVLNEFVKAGPECLQVITDFDHTITKQHMPDGSDVLSTFAIFGGCKSVPAKCRGEMTRMREFYRKIELDPQMDIAEKHGHMANWWDGVGAALVGFPFDMRELDKNTNKFNNCVRDKAAQFFLKLDQLGVPVLITSAGLGDTIWGMLKHANLLYSKVNVCSNFLTFKEGLLDGFSEPAMHTFNKKEKIEKFFENGYAEVARNRNHVLLMGDTLADADMSDAVKDAVHTLKIGFLYHHVELNLSNYLNQFDIVLIDDQTMETPNALLDIIDKKIPY